MTRKPFIPKVQIVHTTSGVALIRKLAEQGYRIFTIERAQEIALAVGITKNYLNQALYYLTKAGWLVRLHKGLYTLSSSVPGINPAHEFEIAMALVNPAAISHWSALHFHGLTEQIPQRIFILTTSSSIPRNLTLEKIKYQCVRVKPERYFGTQKIWLGDARVVITDPDRTLLDGLMKPQYCGDFSEVIHAFELHLPKLKLDRIIEYAIKLDVIVAKRLGWILEHHGIPSAKLEKLASLSIKGYHPLDPTRPSKGICNRYWSIQENLPRKIIK
jgi:predicted transcriptional regulator of viral defense system